MLEKIAIITMMILCSSLAALPSNAQQQTDAHARQWWQNALFYEIYPRSFADSNNDGIGDLNGITSKLDYLHELGVDAIWITPCFPSPQVDFGYDVSDYEAIDPMYGTMEDFDRLLKEAKKRNIRVILDFVVNHTSDQHKWFLDSRSSKTSKYRDWYIWRDGKNGGPPNNWQSEFGVPAWTFDKKTGQYYYNYFYPQQPDLNWRNPTVKDAMLDVTRFWYKRGVAGFRLDAVDTLFEDPNLTDNPPSPGKDKFGRPNFARIYNTKLPEVHDVLQDLRKIADQYDAVLIGETWTKDITELKNYYGENSNELQMPMDLMFGTVNKLSAPEFRRQIAAVDSAGGWPVFVISNHDMVRSYNRYGDGVHNDEIAKLMASLYLTLRGSPIMYYGEELGMQNNDPKRKEDVKDPQGITGWPGEIGRDGERTPMQWNDAKNAGFSNAKPWLPVPPTYKTHNVAAESKDPNSILSVYRQLLAMRHNEPALLNGTYTAINEDDPNVLAYLRKDKNEAILVLLNMSNTPQKIKLNLAPQGFASPKLTVLLSTFQQPTSATSAGAVDLPPFGALITKITK
ncbi:MAG: alpha-glucosidase [Verrucomicrobiota bacterium]|jgi:alpha-glucosidase